jgi:hypothetical protein
MATLDDLPSDVLRLIMALATDGLHVELFKEEHFISTTWCRLATVCKR